MKKPYQNHNKTLTCHFTSFNSSVSDLFGMEHFEEAYRFLNSLSDKVTFRNEEKLQAGDSASTDE